MHFLFLVLPAAFLAAALVIMVLTAPALAGPKRKALDAPDIGALREVTVQSARDLIEADPTILIEYRPSGGTSSSSSKPASVLAFDKLANGLTVTLGEAYQGLKIPGGGEGVKFGAVVYDDSAFARPAHAPTQLEGPLSPPPPATGSAAPSFRPAALVSALCDVPPSTRLPKECALGGSLSIELTYGDVLGRLPLEDTPEVKQALNGAFHIILFWSPAAEAFYPGKAITTKLGLVGRACLLRTTLKHLNAYSADSAVQAAKDGLSAEVAMCVNEKMAAQGRDRDLDKKGTFYNSYHSRGIFVGDKLKTTQYFGKGHAFIVTKMLSQVFFKRGIPAGTTSYLRIVFFPAAP